MTTLRIIDSNNVKEPYYGPHFLVPLNCCSLPNLGNPLLNSLYKPSVSHCEKWYLELRRRILINEFDHPLVHIACVDQTLKKMLVESVVADGSTMLSIIRDKNQPEYHVSASINLKKLRRWSGFFTSLPDSIDALQYLNGPAQD